MAFEGLRDQLKEQWGDLSAKVQESTLFNNLREKFESQTPGAQKAIVAGSAVLVVLFLLSFPYSYYSTSQETVAQFEENRELIKGLLRASRSAKTPSPLPPPMNGGSLRGRVSEVLQRNRLLPEQIGEMNDMPAGAVSKDLAPATVTQTGVVMQLKKINVKQMIQLSAQLQSIGVGVKLVGLDIVQSAGQTHYYDMIVKVVNFGLPQIADSGPDEAPAKEGKRPIRPSANDEGAE